MSLRAIRRRFGLRIVLACLPAWCGTLPICADEQDARQVMVLQSGRLLEGRISPDPNGYVVEHSAGRIVVPFDEARVIGDDLPDAFRRLKESFVNPTAATHYELALWCSSHQLYDEMRAELVLALDRDPDHEAARALLDRIDAEKKAARRRAVLSEKPQAEPRIAYGIELPTVESLAGLSRETATLFTTRIQPLLLNKCGNASCHGSRSETSFRLEQIRGTGNGHRVHSERNLAIVLKEIQTARPVESRLLTHGTRMHGGLTRPIFTGPTGEKQLKMLRNWVRVASKELHQDEPIEDEPSRIVSKQPRFPKTHGPIRAGATISDNEGLQASVRNSADTTQAALKSSPPLPRNSGEGTKTKNIDRMQAGAGIEEVDDNPDAFDPEAFNRRYFGERSRPANSRKSRPRKTNHDRE